MSATEKPARPAAPARAASGAPPNPLDLARRLLERAVLPMTIVGLVAGLALAWSGDHEAAAVAWAIPAVVVAVRLAWAIVRDLAHGELGVDLIAILAIVGALLLGEAFAAAIIGVMLATGEGLERYAQGRAHRDLTALLGRVPHDVQRYVNGSVVTTPIEAVVPGDLLAIRPGDVVPVDGKVVGTAAVLDKSALTGESRLMTREEGSPVSSGTVNASSSFDIRAVSTAADSAYAGIVRLVQEAQQSKAPFVRLADRYALIFVPITLALATVAWLLSGDPVRGLAVLVVATPCPLLLAAPIAIVAGISRAARRGVIVKGGGPLEILAQAGSSSSTRPERSPRAARGWPPSTSVRPRSRRPRMRTRSCDWPPRSSSCRRMRSQVRSSRRPGSGDSCCRCRPMSSRPRGPA